MERHTGGRYARHDRPRDAAGKTGVLRCRVVDRYVEQAHLWRGCNAWFMPMPRVLAELPTIGRFSVLGAMCAGVLGCLAGLIIGLVIYAPTAWAATFELGVPAAILGAIIGSAVGAVVLVSGRASRTKS